MKKTTLIASLLILGFLGFAKHSGAVISTTYMRPMWADVGNNSWDWPATGISSNNGNEKCEALDEATSDEDGRYISSSDPGAWLNCQMSNGSGDTPINSVTMTVRAKGSGSIRFGLRETGGYSEYLTPCTQLSSDYQDYSVTYSLDPVINGPWDYSHLRNDQRTAKIVNCSGDSGKEVDVTQTYFAVNSGVPSEIPIVITTTELPSAQESSLYSQTLQSTGGTLPYTWSISSGILPTGLSLNSSTGVVSGTPTTTGTFNFTVQVTDGNSATASQALSIVVTNPATPTPPVIIVPLTATIGVHYSKGLIISGGTSPFTWSISSGNLPAGLSLDSSTGKIYGTPTETDTSIFTVQVTDANSLVSTLPMAIEVVGWDVTDTWNLSFVANAGAIGTYDHSVTLNQQPDNTLTGNGYYLPDPQYAWVIDSGSIINGNSVHINLHYTGGHPSSWTTTVDGTIGRNGTLSGTWSDNQGNSGTVTTLSGQATRGD